MTGGYYAARIGALEYLKKIKRQAGVIVFREITPEYWLPIGVWQIRENVRAAMQGSYEKFGSMSETLEEVRKRTLLAKGWENKSELLSRFRSREVFRNYLN